MYSSHLLLDPPAALTILFGLNIGTFAAKDFVLIYKFLCEIYHLIRKCLNVTKLSFDSELLTKLLARPDLRIVNEKDENGWTPLMFSVQLNAARFV